MNKHFIALLTLLVMADVQVQGVKTRKEKQLEKQSEAGAALVSGSHDEVLAQPSTASNQDEHGEAVNEATPGCTARTMQHLKAIKERVVKVKASACEYIGQANVAVRGYVDYGAQQLHAGKIAAKSVTDQAKQRFNAAKGYVSDKYKRAQKWYTTDTHLIPSGFIDCDHVYCFGRTVENQIEIITNDGYVFVVPGWIAEYATKIQEDLGADQARVIDLREYLFASANVLYVLLEYVDALHRFDQLSVAETEKAMVAERLQCLQNLVVFDQELSFTQQCDEVSLAQCCKIVPMLESVFVNKIANFLCNRVSVKSMCNVIITINDPVVRTKVFTVVKAMQQRFINNITVAD